MGKTLILTPGFAVVVRKSHSDNEERREGEGSAHRKEVTVTDFRVKDGKAKFDVEL